VFELAIVSDVGGAWPTNEDAYGHWQPNDLEIVFAVADGVGGYGGGEVASRLAIETTMEAFRNSTVAWERGKRLRDAVQQANLAVHNRALSEPGLGRMATTLTAVAIRNGLLWAVHVGDTRMYLVRGDTVQPLTRDHNVGSERARMLLRNADAARADPERSLLTRALGTSLIAPLDRLSLRLRQDDVLVVCTDGVHTLLMEQEIGDYCRGQSAKAACKSLIAAAQRRKPRDNLTVAVLKVGEGAAPEAPAGWRARLKGLLGHAD